MLGVKRKRDGTASKQGEGAKNKCSCFEGAGIVSHRNNCAKFQPEKKLKFKWPR